MATYNGVPMRNIALPQSKYGIKATYPMSAKGVTAHNTYNDATAENEIKYMQSNNNYVSYHAAIDDKEVVFGVPLNRSTWHAGDGSNGYGNRNHISFEICYSKSGGEKYRKAEANAVRVIAQCLYLSKWGINKLKKHQDWSGKFCPHRILEEKRWNQFVDKVAAELNRLIGGEKVDSTPSPTENKPQSSSLAVDGSWGPATTRALQAYFKTTVDGIISGQPNNASTRNIPSAQYGTVGSDLVRAMQRHYGTPVDGYISSPSLLIKEMQRKYGTPVDGIVSNPSLLVKELQRRLNNKTL